jgi:uncharacterized protein (TIGR03382 family)
MVAHRSLAVAVAIVAGGCAVEPSAGSSSQAIIGGIASDPGEFPATGMITARGRLECTATLIAPDVVLTAAHCLKPPTFGELGFTLDTDEADGIADVIPLAFTHMHPDFDESVEDFLDLAVRNDVGVAILKQPITSVPFEEIDKAAFDTPIDNGNELPVCGYGKVDLAGGFGLKRDAMVTVDRTSPFEFSTMAEGPQPCSGDSGAPLFMPGPTSPNGRRIVGLVSRAMGRSVLCDSGAIITRVGQYAGWIGKASRDRDAGCSAGGGHSLWPLVAVFALILRRRRTRS